MSKCPAFGPSGAIDLGFGIDASLDVSRPAAHGWGACAGQRHKMPDLRGHRCSDDVLGGALHEKTPKPHGKTPPKPHGFRDAKRNEFTVVASGRDWDLI